MAYVTFLALDVWCLLNVVLFPLGPGPGICYNIVFRHSLDLAKP